MTGSAIPQIDMCADEHARERAATASAAAAAVFTGSTADA
jgi:hypothetical protein